MEISVSYAVIYMDAKSGKFLIVHPTHETYWSLPKGGMEEADGGDGAKAATRELFEETTTTEPAETAKRKTKTSAYTCTKRTRR